MASGENRSTVLAAVILGVCLLVGLSAGGYFIGKGCARLGEAIADCGREAAPAMAGAAATIPLSKSLPRSSTKRSPPACASNFYGSIGTRIARRRGMIGN